MDGSNNRTNLRRDSMNSSSNKYRRTSGSQAVTHLIPVVAVVVIRRHIQTVMGVGMAGTVRMDINIRGSISNRLMNFRRIMLFMRCLRGGTLVRCLELSKTMRARRKGTAINAAEILEEIERRRRIQCQVTI